MSPALQAVADFLYASGEAQFAAAVLGGALIRPAFDLGRRLAQRRKPSTPALPVGYTPAKPELPWNFHPHDRVVPPK